MVTQNFTNLLYNFHAHISSLLSIIKRYGMNVAFVAGSHQFLMHMIIARTTVLKPRGRGCPSFSIKWSTLPSYFIPIVIPLEYLDRYFCLSPFPLSFISSHSAFFRFFPFFFLYFFPFSSSLFPFFVFSPFFFFCLLFFNFFFPFLYFLSFSPPSFLSFSLLLYFLFCFLLFFSLSSFLTWMGVQVSLSSQSHFPTGMDRIARIPPIPLGCKIFGLYHLK